ncbi:O-antigen ligase family protein [Winogradskyella sp. A3E31]|uniref:O-antigen ligase family protein n=1 Tax=Winogradskyella sp. A3E31 TaxID=3349637 RepID=UPI00398B909B
MIITLKRLYTIKDKTPSFLLLILSFFPLLNSNQLSISLLLFFFFSIFFRTRIIKENFKKYGYKPLIINSLFYLIIVFSLSYSPLQEQGLDIIVRGISFLLFPLTLIYSINITDRLIRYMSIIFIGSNILVILYFVIKLNMLSKFVTNPAEFFNIRFFIEIGKADYKDWHPTYMGLNYLLSILLLLKVIYQSCSYVKKIFGVVLITIFLAFLIILNSRIIIFLTLFSIPLYSLLTLKLLKDRVLILSIIIVSFIVLAQISKNNNIGRLFLEPITYDFRNFSLKKVLGPRYYIQECSLELIKQKPILGYGVGYEKELLSNYCLEIKNFKNQYLSSYSSHNVYLSILFTTGFLGFLALVFMLINNLYLAFNFRNFFYGSVIIIFIFAFLTENYFIRLNGVILFSFINAYFFKKILEKIE